tara:strand:+ start:33 stop:848 length:816 start_codon:yes stop_codon:yes gene_type:complete
MSLVSTNWLRDNMNGVKILDCSWHLPTTNRNPFSEFEKEHIPGSQFFDLDNNSDQNTDLPHMLPKKREWEKIVSLMGISNEDRIIIYDNSDLLSSCRCWFMFVYFGHNSKLVSILDGGMKKWKMEKKPITNKIKTIQTSRYTVIENENMVKDKNEIKNNINIKKFNVVDARSKNRFNGIEDEPRSDVKSGSIPGSINLPFRELLNEDNSFKNIKEIKIKFDNVLRTNNSSNLVMSCGSGVTACVLALAYSLIDNKYRPTIYDGSWSEYGKI